MSVPALIEPSVEAPAQQPILDRETVFSSECAWITCGIVASAVQAGSKAWPTIRSVGGCGADI
jgi:hypothetical protein